MMGVGAAGAAVLILKGRAKKEPCWPEGEQGSKNRRSMSDLELPAYLLGGIFYVSTRIGTTTVPTHDQTARPEGRFGGNGIGFLERH